MVFEWGNIGTGMASLMFIYTVCTQHMPGSLSDYLEKIWNRIVRLMSPYIEISFHEFNGESYYTPSSVFTAIQTYLTTKASSQVLKFRAEVMSKSKSLLLYMDDYEEVYDIFHGVKVWWVLYVHEVTGPGDKKTQKRYYQLNLHKRHKELITGEYIDHVMKEANAIAARHRQRKLYSNNYCPSSDDKAWSGVLFEHPASFETLAMEEKKKEEIMKDLKKFSESKDYYASIGKAWKRGYLLYGPPGTGKSTMVAAIANYLNYHVYDLELTTVKNNRELKYLLIATQRKSVVVIEDIDCTVELTGKRKESKIKKISSDSEVDDDESDDESNRSKKNKEVTLSGLLNMIDGLWSASAGERIFIFTTNHLDKLDPALIRRGRMDKHIEMSYCCFEGFKVLVKNYLKIESHELFGEIGRLLGEVDMTTADVAENITPMSDTEDATSCLSKLIEALKKAKKKTRDLIEEEPQNVKKRRRSLPCNWFRKKKS